LEEPIGVVFDVGAEVVGCACETIKCATINPIFWTIYGIDWRTSCRIAYILHRVVLGCKTLGHGVTASPEHRFAPNDSVR
jgi:hypothetical protein